MGEPGQHLTPSAGGPEWRGQSARAVQGFAGISGTLRRELLHQRVIYRRSHNGAVTNLVFPSWSTDGASVISGDGWKAAPVPGPLAPLAPPAPE